jgi:hypothetical protein
MGKRTPDGTVLARLFVEKLCGLIAYVLKTSNKIAAPSRFEPK